MHKQFWTGLVAIMFLTVEACTGNAQQDVPDIEATVNAAVETAIPTSTPSPTPDIEATVSAAVEAAIPTPTPSPTPDIEETVNAAVAATAHAAATPTFTPTATTVPAPTMEPTPTPLPTLTPSPVPTAIPTATTIPTATATVTPTPTPVSVVQIPTALATREPTTQYPACGDSSIFTVSPTSVDEIDHIVALGNLNPAAGHVFPTDHMYFYLADPDSDRSRSTGVTDVVSLFSPGNLTVTNLRADEHVDAGITDYGMTLTACEDIWLNFGHLVTLSPDLFGRVDFEEGWDLPTEYSTGAETHRTWRKDVDVVVSAGQVLGTAGGNPGVWGWDFGMVDLRATQDQNVANPVRYSDSPVLNSVCFLHYYEEGPTLDQLISLVKRVEVEGETIPCGSHLQDVPGTAQGNWFLSGNPDTYPEDPHLALVRSNFTPTNAVLSVGISIQGMRPGPYEFIPTETGVLNRDFKDITADGRTYGFEIARQGPTGFEGIVIVYMPDGETLWIEAFAELTTTTDGSVRTQGSTPIIAHDAV